MHIIGSYITCLHQFTYLFFSRKEKRRKEVEGGMENQHATASLTIHGSFKQELPQVMQFVTIVDYHIRNRGQAT